MGRLTGSPQDAVRAWWQALADADLATLSEVLDEEHLSVGMGARTSGRHAALRQTEEFLLDGSVDRWGLRDMEERALGDGGQVTLCCYRWDERGSHAGVPFQLSGYATDVVVRSSRGWVVAAHHTSTTSSPTLSEPQP